MHEAGLKKSGGMAAIIGLDEVSLNEICAQSGTQIANINCPGQLVISGAKGNLAEAIELAKARGAYRTVPLQVSGAFHTQSMQPAVDGLSEIIASLSFSEPAIPIIGNTTAQPLTTAEHNILELLMVGEAKYYLKAENDVDRWRTELKRLIEEIKRQQVSGVDEIDSLMRLRALCREALRVLPDMAYYFQELERVRHFEDATRDAIDVETRRSLANLIKEMMESDQL